MESAKGIQIPIIADFVERPYFYYIEDDKTGIYFQTEDGQFGRITFLNIDSYKISRGEHLPYNFTLKKGEDYPWVYEIENSKWKEERYMYEKKHYGSSYEWSGNVEEMLSDFKHYLFKFHDEFIEVIAKGFWYEKSKTNLKNKPLQESHPSLAISNGIISEMSFENIKYRVVSNQEDKKTLIRNAYFFEQKILEIYIELEQKYTLFHTLLLQRKSERIYSVLKKPFTKDKVLNEGLVTFEEARNLIEQSIEEVSERRKQMGK